MSVRSILGFLWFCAGLSLSMGCAKTIIPPRLVVHSNPENIARGEYLANHVSVCMDCHSQRNWTIYTAPPRRENFGGGGEVFGKELGLPGRIVAQNITPKALGNWSDAEIARAIVSGQSRDGHALFPIMPYPSYNNMAPEDLGAIIAYLRTLKAAPTTPAASTLDFPVNIIVNTMPMPYSAPAKPRPEDRVAYGKYLVAIASCAECHTPANDKGQKLPGLDFAGGRVFKLLSGGEVISANLTPDKKSGLGDMKRDTFIKTFKNYADPANLQPLKPGQVNTLMPWSMYAGMSEEDLGAIYDYLRSIPAKFTKALEKKDIALD